MRVLIIDDWGLEKITTAQRYDLMEIMDDRYGENSTVIVSQLPVSEWHGTIGDNTVADARQASITLTAFWEENLRKVEA